MTLQESIERPAMNRHGKKRRKRATGARTATGRARQPAVDFRAQAALQPHRSGLPAAVRLSEKAGSVLGCLNLLGGISEQQYEAGRRYAVIVGQYLASADAPRSTAGTGRGYPCFGLGCPPEYCECLMRRNRYMRAYEAIPDRKAHMAINRVIDDELISPAQLEHLIRGLRALARHFGLTTKAGTA